MMGGYTQPLAERPWQIWAGRSFKTRRRRAQFNAVLTLMSLWLMPLLCK